MKNLPKILITGAGGFIGQYACQYFEKVGYEVYASHRTPPPSAPKGGSVEVCNLLDQNQVRQLVKKVQPDNVLHLAAQNDAGRSWKSPVHTIETNVLSTLYMIDAIREMNPSCRFITAGSALQPDLNRISDLPHPYSLSKTLQVLTAQAWEILFQLDVVIAKPANIIGPGPSNGICSILAKKIVEMEQRGDHEPIEVTSLEARRDFLDVRDAVSGLKYLIENGKNGEVYEIASGVSLSIGEVIDYFKTLTPVKFTVHSHNEQGDCFTGSPQKLMELGWKPKIPFEQSFEDLLNYYRNQII
ncbi:NAD-dependent epimerase/dehydratase family protein [Cytobacillus firmus]|uniref:NAD-dependent epimerase/dehydratase family protein n=1 Tax=Cytobacillus firmus TaxID=1399 RepID=UPI001C96113A|nr:NAD-dependent epimerase/dehydratase family protein [Cytobacillus firmus]MBY6053356.1 NAD-dependent epimerase/dehydratase family protein [Cytobacillus firmus]USK41231.1 NAD-dependent epimerase/dehydratase family protein [Cytobacillus firmus]